MTQTVATTIETIVTVLNDSTIQVATVGIQGPQGADGTPVSSILVVTTDTTLLPTNGTVVCDTTAGNITITLAPSASVYDPLLHTGQIFNIAKPISAHVVTVVAQGSDTVNGVSSLSFNAQANLQVQCGPGGVYVIL